jgi:hypothetical protein
MATRRGWTALAALTMLTAPWGAVALGQQNQDVEEAVQEIRTAQQLLVALERIDDRVDTLQSDVQYDKRFRLQGDRHVRRGKLFYKAEREGGERVRPSRKFEIDFQTLWLVSAGRQEDSRQTWIFDGEWLIEKRPDKKQFVARQIAAPGDDFDPLSIEEGIMPIPIGQRAADVLERFEVELVPHPAGLEDEPKTLTTFVDGCHQLRLVPKAARAEDAKFREIRLWYEKESLMPRMSRAVDRGGDVSFVQLLNVKRNERLPRGTIVVTPPPEGQGWDVQIERRRADAGGGR